MPAAMSESLPLPSASRTLPTMIRASHAAPATPLPLSESAAATPATSVPCPLSSVGVASLLTMSFFRPIRPTRSGWFVSMPESRIAMSIVGEPCVRSQAAGRRDVNR
jgi:hypothetical protein